MHKTLLSNDTTVITLERPQACSCALGLWLENGSRHQLPQQNGYAHLLEHLLFKGDAALTAQFDALGGQINAHTGRELTSWYGVVAADDGSRLLQLLVSRLIDFDLSAQQLDSERRVVMQELAGSTSGSPQALQEQAIATLWRDQPIAYPLLGDAGVLQTATVAAMRNYLRGLRVGSRLAVVAVGAVDHQCLLETCSRLTRLAAGQRPQPPPPHYQPQHQPGRPFIYRRDDQAIVQWLLPAAAARMDDKTYAALLLADHIVGGGSHSRLYRILRERHGLTYATRSALEFYSDHSLWSIQLDCSAAQIDHCIALVGQEMGALIASGPAPAELEVARAHLVARLQIMQDDHLSMMQRLAREHFYFGLHPDSQAYTHKLYSVSCDDIRSILTGMWQS
jgi:predicted Zn-dependent peptidase